MMENNKKLKVLFFILIAVVAFSFMANQAMANNLSIENFEVYSTDATTNTITFSCDISWENSWRNVTNYDAVWVFLKYSTNAGATWSHASMSSSGTNPAGFNSPTGFEIVAPNDEKGFFLQRTDLASGNVNTPSVRFVWDYSQDGLSDETAMAANTINKIFGIEMVYIPEGSFYLGDGNSSSAYKFKQGGSDDDPWYIQNENAITTTSTSADGFYYQSSGASGESSTASVFLIPTSFPKGYKAFYQMKYELTEGQWVAFFNTLTSSQKTNRDITSANEGGKNSDSVANRNTVSWDSSNLNSSATSSRPDRSVSYISWPDMLAYADWSALRPTTELEFEKSARGVDISSVVDELAWGNTSVNNAEAGEIYPDADEDGDEQISDSGANINRNNSSWSSGDGRTGGDAQGQKGPLRAGVFAESSTTRTTSGAGYYGTMELSGNLHEMVASVGKSEGRQFLGTHGDGELTTISGYEGNATNIDWPGINSIDSARGITGTIGSGYRGGDFNNSS
ncbi:MAG: SUMF1/EgtB/PvdO family nonheme iron enzyme, partial [Candidatus Zapsychrus exili]|nr:SUMF1/EgtB/PvdO family nonheme iron enzyme [Candidatus Zapsychrus exili]